MPSLFATDITNSVDKKIENFNFGRTYAYDFENKCLIKEPSGKIKLLSIYESYLQWCKMALVTTRNHFEAYSSNFGIDNINKDLDYKALQLEIKRAVSECLKTHPFTSSVENFVFTREGTRVYYNFDLVSTYGKDNLNSYLEVVN